MTRRISNTFNKFLDLRFTSDEDIIYQSKKMKIDIAIDLNGFTYNNRKNIFLKRVAPLQINFLGWPGTFGSSMDYIIADKNLIPKEILNSGLDAVVDFCKVEADNLVEDQEFNLKANEWFREFTYDMELDKGRSSNFLEHFNRHGSSAFKEINLNEKEFTPKELLKNCSAITRLIEQAKVNKKLEHEARLFLCSILTYNEESIKFLYSILSLCDDFNYEKSTSHINDWIKRRQIGIGGRPYTCDRANSAGVGCGDCHLEKKKKWITVGNKYIESTEELSPSPIRFAYKQKGDKKNAS